MEKDIKNILKKYLMKDQILIDVNEKFESGFIRIVVDSEDTITLDDTTALTRRLLKSDEFNDRYPDGCRIEITTPGLDYPLKYAYQFKKNINRKVNIRFRKDDELDAINCKILSADDDIVMVKHRNSDIPISYNQIKDAKLILSFK
jgi:ribosome maturation factor RimP